MNKLFRIATIAMSHDVLLKGQLAFLQQHYRVTAVSAEPQKLRQVAAREGVAWRCVEMNRKMSPFRDMVSLWKLYQLFRREKPAIVHSITPKAGLLSMIAARAAGVPVRMHAFTGLVFPTCEGFMQKLLITTDRILCACATHVYPEGEGVKNDLKRYRITRKPLRVLANGNVNGIDLAYFDPKAVSRKEKEELARKLEITPDDFVFVFVGRITRDKGIHELLDAFDRLSRKYTSVKLLLVGPTETAGEAVPEKSEKIMKHNRAIIRVGFQFDIRPYLAVSDVLVLPSYREGFPNVVMQAGAMGLPSIVTDINGSNEIVRDRQNGIIIPPKDAQALFDSMEQVLNNSELLEIMRANAREAIASRFERSVVWNALLEEYRRLEKEHE